MHYKRWRTKAVLWFTNLGCFSATDARPEGPLSAEEQEKFEKVDAMFKAALFSILGDNIVDPYMAFDHGKDAWDALEAKFGVSDAGTELYVMEQYYDYRMTDERSVVEQAHEIQSLAKELEQFKCTLPDKFVAGGIIAKLPPSWRNFATSLKHKRQEFSVSDLIGSLHVEEKARAKDTRARSFEGGSSANVVQKKNFQSHKSKNKNNGKGKFDEKNKASNSTNFKKKTPYKKKGNCHVCGAPGHWAPDCPERHDRRGNSGKSANVVIGVDTEMKDVGYGISPTVLSVARTCSVLMGNGSRASVHGVDMASPINFNQFLEKEKLKSNGSNFTDWFRHVRIFLNGGNLQYVLDAPLGDPPAETETDGVKNVYATRKTRLGINRVLQSLPPSYKNFVMNYNMQNMNKEFPELFGMLKAAEIEIKKEHQVLMVNKTTSFKKQGKSKGKFKKGGKKAAAPPVKPKSGPKPDAECYYCKEKGHWKRNCSKYLADLKSGLVKKKKEGIEHWTAVKNILKYLKRTKDMFLCYGGDQELVVTSYTDASWNTDPDDSKSQSGYVFILNGAAVSWASSKQCTVAKSSTESEYIAASEASSKRYG
ncbi:hypothetical protein QYE76_066267 [Lolium multiflorum]|uniref:CCHC-type domain-containing protein n=1 Tax=Lolium multiflorum TaxID=4521 RepID=A0AAD8SCC2_LOLMU|nr:hypothetical protein QYE76_066267 [Lolium multiflorum]